MPAPPTHQQQASIHSGFGGIGAGFGSPVGAGGMGSYNGSSGGWNPGGGVGGPGVGSPLGGMGSYNGSGGSGIGGLPGSLGGIGAFGGPGGGINSGGIGAGFGSPAGAGGSFGSLNPGGMLGSDYSKPRQNPFSDPNRFTFGGRPFASKFGRGMLAGVDPSVLSRLVGLQTAYGAPLNITSGFRDPARNKKAGGAKKSQHILGHALDISLPDESIAGTTNFLGLASQYGFNGLGVYGPGSVHIDTGTKRAWGPSRTSSSIPGWAGGTIASHMAGKFGTAPQNMGAAPSVASIGAPSPTGLGIGPGASAMASMNPQVNPTASGGIGPGAAATGGVSMPGATASLSPGIGPSAAAAAAATPSYPDAQQGSWLGNLGAALGSGLDIAKAYGADYLTKAKSPENIAAFAKQNPMGAMKLAGAFGSLSPGAFGSGGANNSFRTSDDIAKNQQLAAQWFQSNDKERDTPKKKQGGKKPAQQPPRWVFPSLLARPYTLIS